MSWRWASSEAKGADLRERRCGTALANLAAMLRVHKEADEKGNTVIEKDTHREGIAGSTESRTKTETDRDGGTTTTRSKTTTKQD